MKFSTREDLALSPEEAFERLTDFEHYERRVVRRGGDIERIDDAIGLREGAHWKVRYSLRGRRRDMDFRLTKIETPHLLVYSGKTGGLDIELAVQVTERPQGRSQLIVSAELKPLNLSARLLIQSLKLAKTATTKRFKSRIAEFASELESREA